MAHRDSKGVAVWDFIVYDGLNVDGLQLEVNGYVDQPGEEAERLVESLMRRGGTVKRNYLK